MTPKLITKPLFPLILILTVPLFLFSYPPGQAFAATSQTQEAPKETTAYNVEPFKFSIEERKVVLEKLKKGKSLSLREQKIRIEILKEQYPIDWFGDMFDFRDYEQAGLFEWCEDYFISRTLKCYPYVVIEHLTPQQIKSIILHSDGEKEWADFRIWDMIAIILTITDELDKVKGHPERLETKKDLINVGHNLQPFYPSEIKTKYWGIYEAYYGKDTECTSYVNPASERGNCLDFSLSEIKSLRKKNLILKYYGCTLSDMPGHPRCPVGDGVTELY